MLGTRPRGVRCRNARHHNLDTGREDARTIDLAAKGDAVAAAFGGLARHHEVQLDRGEAEEQPEHRDSVIGLNWSPATASASPISKTGNARAVNGRSAERARRTNEIVRRVSRDRTA